MTIRSIRRAPQGSAAAPPVWIAGGPPALETGLSPGPSHTSDGLTSYTLTRDRTGGTVTPTGDPQRSNLLAAPMPSC